MLQIKNLSKAFNGRTVLENLSLTVENGEIVALVGSSGSGKTTLLNLISGLQAPDKGTIACAGKLSYLFQESRLLPWRTVYENICLVRDRQDPAEIQRLICAVGLEGFETYYPAQLSGGMARRCALVRAFYYGGDFFLMDEPFSGLDYGIRMDMLELLLQVWREKQPGILFVTHEIDEALTIGTRVMLLGGTPARIQKEIRLPGKEGRNLASEDLIRIRGEIINGILRTTGNRSVSSPHERKLP